MINVNDYKSFSDNETIENAIKNKDSDGIVVIPQRSSDIEPERSYWLLDRAILLPENTTVILQNCTIKLSDKCRDNFFRSANCGIGIEDPEPISNIRIKGEGAATLIGADHPRASGDGGKKLSAPCPYTVEDLCKYADWIPEERKMSGELIFEERHGHSYGTDAGKEGESQYGDWRGIGILLANVNHFSISGIKIVESHGWAISLEACTYGSVEKIEFDARMSKMIDGMLNNMENQDGIDLRNGCNNIIISDITGKTGDDVIALTAIASPNYRPGGSLRTTHAMHNDWSRRDASIHDVIIRNVVATSDLCHIIRLLPCNTEIYNVVIDGVIDTATSCDRHSTAIALGALDSAYGKNLPNGLHDITVSNVISSAKKAAIRVDGYLNNATITNIVNKNSNAPMILVRRENALKNVLISNTTPEN